MRGLLSRKHAVDLDPRPGRFLLTGSARLYALHEIPDLLLARVPSYAGAQVRRVRRSVAGCAPGAGVVGAGATC